GVARSATRSCTKNSAYSCTATFFLRLLVRFAHPPQALLGVGHPYAFTAMHPRIHPIVNCSNGQFFRGAVLTVGGRGSQECSKHWLALVLGGSSLKHPRPPPTT